MELLDWVRGGGQWPDGSLWSWEDFTQNPDVTPELMKEYAEMPWSNVGRFGNVNTRFEDLPEEFRKNLDNHHNWANLHLFLSYGRYTLDQVFSASPEVINPGSLLSILRNRQVTMEMILARSDIPWSKYSLSYHPELTLQLYLDSPTNWVGSWLDWEVVRMPGFSYKDIVSHPKLRAYLSRAAMNPSISPETILAHPDQFTDLTAISLNPHLRPSHLLQFASQEIPFPNKSPHFPLKEVAAQIESNYLFYHPELTLAFILANPQYKWSYDHVVRYLREPPAYRQMKIVSQERTNPASYLALLPPDMLSHYLQRYVTHSR